MSQFKSVDTNGAGPPIQVPADELDAATVERCAQVIEDKHRNNFGVVHSMAASDASAIRSLIPNSAGDVSGSHPRGEAEPVVKQVPSPAGTVSELDQVNSDLKFWEDFVRPFGFVVIGWTYRDSAQVRLPSGAYWSIGHKEIEVLKIARALLSQFDVRRK